MGLVEADPAQVGRRGRVEVAPEGELDGADGDAGRAGDVGDGDVDVGVAELVPVAVLAAVEPDPAAQDGVDDDLVPAGHPERDIGGQPILPRIRHLGPRSRVRHMNRGPPRPGAFPVLSGIPAPA